MLAEAGHFALILALALALVQAVLPLWGSARGHAPAMAVAAPAAWAQSGFVLVAYLCLTHSFWVSDFSVALAAQHSHRSLPWYYRLTAVWGNHEGSVLLWALVLAGWTSVVAWAARRRQASGLARARAVATALATGPEAQAARAFDARVLGVLGLISLGFLAFILFTSNPFLRLLPAASSGGDLNPMLQDPGMAIHPPMLYMGYVGLAVPFAGAVAALMGGQLDAAWARWSRPWATLAWCFLTLGIALGSFWAYYELGWGGWWFWDPVENASFMPWLVGTALIHSLSVSAQRGGLRLWTALLAILAFSLSLLGTFIVRSGVLSSVHAFASDPARGVFILVFLALVAGGALALFAWRGPHLGAGAAFAAVSRESLLLLNNVLLLVAAAAVLLGTVYPLVIDALGMGKLSVGPPYFNAVFVPLMAPALFLMALGPLARWRQADLPSLARRLRGALAVAVLAALGTVWLREGLHPGTAFGLGIAVWIAAATLVAARDRVRGLAANEANALDPPGLGRQVAAVLRVPGRFWGMALAHLGVAVFIVGVTVVGSFQTEADVRMAVGDRVRSTGLMGTHELVLERVELVQGPNYRSARATFSARRDGVPVATLQPERRVYSVRGSAMTEVAIDRSLWRDLYVALGEPVDERSWSVRVHHKPMVNWIWLGCLMMALGGTWALASRLAARGRERRHPARALAAPRVAAGAGVRA